MSARELIVVGGGLSGSEAAWQAAELGVQVRLYEMRPRRTTPAHVTDRLAELVCSNSLGALSAHKAPGLLKAELRGLGSLILDCAERTAVPAGASLAVDREQFAACVSERVAAHSRIELVRQEITAVPDPPCIIATGPLTSAALTAAIGRLTGQQHLYFYDALSPIVDYETIDMNVAFRRSRYDKGEQEEGDYINCPLTETEYERFYDAVVNAETITLRQFEQEDPRFFEGCMPIEVLAGRGKEALAFGPMRPVGLIDPRTGKRPYAVVQLRQDNLAGTLYNIVGFQTNLKWGEQRRVLRLIPGLEKAEFMRYGMMHRNILHQLAAHAASHHADAPSRRPVLRRPDRGHRGLRWQRRLQPGGGDQCGPFAERPISGHLARDDDAGRVMSLRYPCRCPAFSTHEG